MCLLCGEKCKCDFKKKSCVFMSGSLVAVVLAMIGALGYDLYLASTQWLLVSVILATWAVFAKEK
ncbi:hypothetical protein KJ965_00095 [Patescibacteria group bacterium]|nr:hypothetical protein [Patescibacteria group bacterium]